MRATAGEVSASAAASTMNGACRPNRLESSAAIGGPAMNPATSKLASRDRAVADGLERGRRVQQLRYSLTLRREWLHPPDDRTTSPVR